MVFDRQPTLFLLLSMKEDISERSMRRERRRRSCTRKERERSGGAARERDEVSVVGMARD